MLDFQAGLWFVLLEGRLFVLPLGPEKNHRKVVREAEVINSCKKYLMNTYQVSAQIQALGIGHKQSGWKLLSS